MAFPFEELSRNVIYNYWWLGRLANGTDIAPGKYKYVFILSLCLKSVVILGQRANSRLTSMRIAVLAPFGNPHASDNWDRIKTPMIEVLVD